jgi:hypothetical protein
MQNPFEDIENFKESDKFISTYDTKSKDKPKYIFYILIGLIYLLEIFTTTFGGVSTDPNNGLFNSKLTLQNWLIPSGIYGILGLMYKYQFNLKVYKNKIYFIIYDFIKICWMLIGTIILFGFNKLKDSNFIIIYSLFYIIFNIIYISFTLSHTLRLKNIL